MTFAKLFKLAPLSALVVVFTIALAGCGSDDHMTLTQGNWSVGATSNGDALQRQARFHRSAKPRLNVNMTKAKPLQDGADFYVGGNFTQTGTGITATLTFVDFCSDSSGVPFTGSVSGTTATLTSSALDDGTVFTVSLTGTAATTTTSLTGTYTVTGGCDDGDSGTLTANLVAPISGTWSGTLTNCTDQPLGCAPATISIVMAQAATASSNGTFAITGPVTYTDSSCSSNGSLSTAYITGEFVYLNDTPNDTGSFTYGLSQIDSTSAPANMTGTYVDDEDSQNCGGDEETVTLSLN